MALGNGGDILWCAQSISEFREKQLILLGESRKEYFDIPEQDDAFQYLLCAAEHGDIKAQCRLIEGYASGTIYVVGTFEFKPKYIVKKI